MKNVLCFLLLMFNLGLHAQNDSISAKKTESVLTLSDSVSTFEKPLLEFASVEFNPGFSLPTGNFASGDYTNPLAGYAKEGYSLGANLSVKVSKVLNVMLCYSRQLNVFDEKSFEVNALKGTTNYTLQTDANWKNHFMLAGVSGNIPLDEENILTPRLLMGICLTKTPKYEIFPINTGTAIVIPHVVESESAVQFAVKVGVGIKKNLNKQFFISINPDFYYTDTKLNINKSFPKNSANHQSISIISLSISLGFRIYR